MIGDVVGSDDTAGRARFLEYVRVDAAGDPSGHPFDVPVVRWLMRSRRLSFRPGVTFLVGENGSGKSTLVEAIAVAARLNAEGGSRNFRFSTRSSESSLDRHLVLGWGTAKPRTDFFLRAESFYNVATEIESRSLQQFYGGSPHHRSHGESFLDLATHRFGPNGLYLLDEPEAALSVRGCMALLARLADLVAKNCQMLIATHSPVLLALPGATILEIDDDGSIAAVPYDEALPVRLTREFLAAPERLMRILLDDGE
jgi:predicted ATPase